MKPGHLAPLLAMMLVTCRWSYGPAYAAEVSGIAREWTFTIGPVGAVLPALFYVALTAAVCRWRCRRRKK